ncbi:MAG: hypothetical protein PHS37_03110 [Candidatus Omnitrophica bacterium]|nr:hypothetical protein [Candidatus Omnitrophota bacterium]
MINISSASSLSSGIRRAALPVLFLIIIGYLLYDTGLVSDDFDAMERAKLVSIKELLMPTGVFYFFETPVEYFTHFIWYRFFDLIDPLFASFIKFLYVSLSLFMISRFLSLFTGRVSSYLIAFLFLFYPSHDATVYWFMGQYLMLSFALYCYAYYLADKNRLFLAFLVALLGTFLSYGSPITALGLCILCCLVKKFRNAVLLGIPMVMYVGYYYLISSVMPFTQSKIKASFSALMFIKFFLLQAATFIDAALGPSLWLKIVYSFTFLTPFSVILGLSAVIWLNRFYRDNPPERFNGKLIAAFSVMAVAALGVFAATARYPQLAFNLGNRTTIFGSLLLSYALLSLPMHRLVRLTLAGLMIFSILGIRDHWNELGRHQRSVVMNIKKNSDLAAYTAAKTVYVTGNLYSSFGPFSHVELLSETWTTAPFFRLILGKDIYVIPLTARYKFENGALINPRNKRAEPVDTSINVYDSEKDLFFPVPKESIPAYLKSLPMPNRHWVQAFSGKRLEDEWAGFTRR